MCNFQLHGLSFGFKGYIGFSWDTCQPSTGGQLIGGVLSVVRPRGLPSDLHILNCRNGMDQGMTCLERRPACNGLPQGRTYLNTHPEIPGAFSNQVEMQKAWLSEPLVGLQCLPDITSYTLQARWPIPGQPYIANLRVQGMSWSRMLM